MRSGLGRRSGVVAALVLTVLSAGPVSPAFADSEIVRPAEGATLQTSAVTVSGRAEAQTTLGLALGTLESVTLKIGEQTVTSPGCSGVRTCEFTGGFALPRNGSYTVEVTARTTALANAGTLPPRTFSVAAPAATPVLDSPKVTAGRTVELSWTRNTEPDMIQYEVTRTDPGAPRPVTATVAQPERGAKVTFTDPTTAALDAGTYTYEVKAVRRGAAENSKVFSEASRKVSASVPAVATTTTLNSTVATSVPAGGPTTTARPGPPAGVDLSGFLSSRSQPIPVPTITVPEPPDTGFSGSLPFGVGPGGEELEEGEADAVPPRDRRRSSSVVSIDAGRPLVPIAGGLVLLLLALHMRLLGRRVKAAPDGDLPVELAPEPPRAAPAPEPRPQPALYDVALDPDPQAEAEDEHWAVGAEALLVLEDEPAAVVEPEPEPMVDAPVALEYQDDEYEEEFEDWSPAPVEPVAPEYEPDDDDWAAAATNVGPLDIEPLDIEPRDIEPVHSLEPDPEPVALWGPPVADEEPPPAEFDPDAIEVVEVVSSSRRRLVRTGSR